MSEKTKNQSRNPNVDQEVEVLYQRMGDRWYAFSLIEDEVFFGSLTAEEIQGNGLPTSNQENTHEGSIADPVSANGLTERKNLRRRRGTA